MALVDDKGVGGDIGGGNLVSSKEPDHLGGGLGGLGGGSETNIVGTCSRSRSLQHVVTIPVLVENGGSGLDELSNGGEESAGILSVGDSGSDNDQGVLGLLEDLAEVSGEGLLEVSVGGTEVSNVKGGIEGRTNGGNLQILVEPRLSDSSVHNGSLSSRVSADQQNGVGVLNTSNGRVEQVVGSESDTVGGGRRAGGGVDGGVLGTKGVGEILESNHRLDLNEGTGNGLELVSDGSLGLVGLGNGAESIVPGSVDKLVSNSDEGSGESLGLETVAGESRLVVDPLLVDLLVDSGDDSHHLDTLGVDSDVGANSVHNINGLGLLELPWSSSESVGLVGQSTNGTQVNDVTGKLRVEVLLQVGSDLHVVSSTTGSELGGAGNIVSKPHTSGAVDASVHGGLDQGTNVLVLGGSLSGDFGESTSVSAVSHALVLQITLSSLVTNGAVEGMVLQHHLHDVLTSLLDSLGVGSHNHAGADRVGTRGDGLGSSLNINQTHSTVTGNGQLVVVAVSGDGNAGLLAGLDKRGAGLNRDLVAIDGEFNFGEASGRDAESSCGCRPEEPGSSKLGEVSREHLC